MTTNLEANLTLINNTKKEADYLEPGSSWNYRYA
tara:strand:- start:1879 stop:1980 length:102 start_codon:yes stop_codon:yes gene_type:complete